MCRYRIGGYGAITNYFVVLTDILTHSLSVSPYVCVLSLSARYSLSLPLSAPPALSLSVALSLCLILSVSLSKSAPDTVPYWNDLDFDDFAFDVVDYSQY